MATIVVDNVHLNLPVLGYNARSIRRVLLNVSTGGRILRDAHDKIVVSALNGVSFKLEEGDRLGLLGHNGAGKSSLLRVLAGIYEPSNGRVSVDGRISSLLDPALGLDPEATGKENINLLARYRGASPKAVADAYPKIEEMCELGGFLDLPVKTYSAGMMARLMFSVAVSFQPDILLMDEWLVVGDAEFVKKAERIMNDFVARARVLVMATHSENIVSAVCNKAMVLEHGRAIDFGDTAEVLKRRHAASSAA